MNLESRLADLFISLARDSDVPLSHIERAAYTASRKNGYTPRHLADRDLLKLWAFDLAGDVLEKTNDEETPV